jgi:hypothetical protein
LCSKVAFRTAVPKYRTELEITRQSLIAQGVIESPQVEGVPPGFSLKY